MGFCGWSAVGGRRSVMVNVLRVGFYRIVYRVRLVFVGLIDLVTRYGCFGAVCFVGKCSLVCTALRYWVLRGLVAFVG